MFSWEWSKRIKKKEKKRIKNGRLKKNLFSSSANSQYFYWLMQRGLLISVAQPIVVCLVFFFLVYIVYYSLRLRCCPWTMRRWSKRLCQFHTPGFRKVALISQKYVEHKHWYLSQFPDFLNPSRGRRAPASAAILFMIKRMYLETRWIKSNVMI